MQIIKQACGAYETNCYILFGEHGEIIIDPGFDALHSSKTCKNPLAILNTHGHYDHVWDNEKVKQAYQIPIYIHKNDTFMLEDPFNQGFMPSKANYLIDDENIISIGGLDFNFTFTRTYTRLHYDRNCR